MVTMTSAGEALRAMRSSAPLVQCITNFVAMNFTANILLAAGAAPAMVHTSEESGEFAAIANALTINIGTLSPSWVEGMHSAIGGAQSAERPWVLDPVGHFATRYRSGVARDLLSLGPTILRGNASEILALSGKPTAGRGVDAGDSVAAAEDAARLTAQRHNTVVAVTGAVDYVTDGTRGAHVYGGHPLMSKVTATGCALTGLTGAFVACVPDPFDAAIAALSCFAAAGAEAATGAQGPGTFAVRFLDAVHALDSNTVDAIRVEHS